MKSSTVLQKRIQTLREVGLTIIRAKRRRAVGPSTPMEGMYGNMMWNGLGDSDLTIGILHLDLVKMKCKNF